MPGEIVWVRPGRCSVVGDLVKPFLPCKNSFVAAFEPHFMSWYWYQSSRPVFSRFLSIPRCCSAAAACALSALGRSRAAQRGIRIVAAAIPPFTTPACAAACPLRPRNSGRRCTAHVVLLAYHRSLLLLAMTVPVARPVLACFQRATGSTAVCII